MVIITVINHFKVTDFLGILSEIHPNTNRIVLFIYISSLKIREI